MRAELHSRKIKNAYRFADAVPEVATVGVIWNYHILMGKRNDSGKWTTPGGHFEPGEQPYEAAARELYEEAGIRGVLKSLGCETLISERAREIKVHAFRMDTPRKPTTTLLDPDGEIEYWEWVPFHMLKGFPKQLRPENLHAKRNLLLKYLGLQEW